MSTSHPAETDADAESDSSRESFTGQGLPRVEDHRILTGEAEYIHDITPENCLHMALVRSMHAHAEIVSIDTEEAEAHLDCELVLTAEDIKSEYNPMPTGVGRIATGEDGEPAALPEWALADEKVRFVGEPVVAVVASDRYAAEDIADLVDVEYEAMDAVADGMAAREDEVVLHESVGSNVVDNERLEFGDPDAAFEDADHVVEGEYTWGRISGVPLETAGAVATYDEESDSFDIDCNIQLHTLVDNMIYETLGYEADDVRVNVPADVGGSYGTKIGIHRYCCLTSMASQQLERPVKFEEDRLENLQGGDMHSSDREYQMRMAVDNDGTMRGLDVWFVDDFGAYPRYPINQVLKPLSVLTNSYEIDDVTYEYDLVLTNKTSQTAYRGFGVDPHIYALEMIVDEAARALDMDPTEFRRRNLIRPEQMPYTLPSKNLYDSGDYPATLDRIEEIIADERDGGLLDPEVVAAKREEGKYRGVQPSVIIEPGASGSDWTDRQRTDKDDLATLARRGRGTTRAPPRRDPRGRLRSRVPRDRLLRTGPPDAGLPAARGRTRGLAERHRGRLPRQRRRADRVRERGVPDGRHALGRDGRRRRATPRQRRGTRGRPLGRLNRRRHLPRRDRRSARRQRLALAGRNRRTRRGDERR